MGHSMANRRRAKQPAKESDRLPLLRRGDQAVVAALVMLSLAGMAAYYVVQGGFRGSLIEIDRASPLEARFRVDLNQAEWPELSQLPEVGETLARRIVESRSVNGPFKDNDDLQRVRGIGPRTMERIKPYLLPRPSQQEVAGGSASPSENLP
jgi:competence protein ComEA